MNRPNRSLRTRGGKRRGAGRPRLHERPGVVGPGVPHTPRPAFARWSAIHVIQRVRPGVGYLRKQGPAQVLLGAFRDAAATGAMRIVHSSIHGNHLHFIIEAKDTNRLSRGMQGLAIRIARRLNRRLHRAGPVFADRFHAHLLSSPRQAANAVRYVAANFRHHLRESLPAHVRDALATQRSTPLAVPQLRLLRRAWRGSPRRGALFEPR